MCPSLAAVRILVRTTHLRLNSLARSLLVSGPQIEVDDGGRSAGEVGLVNEPRASNLRSSSGRSSVTAAKSAFFSRRSSIHLIL